MTLHTLSRWWTTLVLLCLVSLAAQAQISVTALPFAPAVTDFNTYNGGTLPTGWTSQGTFRGAGTGSSTTGGLYAFGAGSDFSAGALNSGTAGTLSYTVSYVNNSGSTINSITLAWQYRQYRFMNTSGWNCTGTGALASNATLNAMDFVGSASGTQGSGAVTAVSSFTLNGLSIANGQAFGVTWVVVDQPSSDNGIAIDNFSISASGPQPALTAGTVTAYGTQLVGSTTDRTFTLSGANLTGAPGNITVTAPSVDFQVSNNGTTWASSATVAYSSATLASTNVFVRFFPQTPGVKSGNVSISGGGATASVAVSGTATNSLTRSVASLTFGNQNVGSQSASQNFTVSGNGLLPASGSITATAPSTDFQVSNNNSTWGASTTLAYTGGALNAVPVYVRFTPGSGGAKSGNVTLSGGSFSSPPSVAVSGTGIVVGAATLTSSIPSASFADRIVSTPSASQSFTIAGTDLVGAPGNITLTSANADYQVSNNNSTWGATATVPFTSATLANTTVYVRFVPQAVGARPGSIAITGASAPTVTVTLSGNGVQPLLSATPLEAFEPTCVNSTGSTFAFDLTGTNLSTADVTVGPLDGFLFFDGSDFLPSLTLPQPGGTFTYTVNVRFVPTAVQSYSGNIPVSGGGASAINVAASATGIDAVPDVATGTASGITMNGATIGGNVNAEGCSSVIAMGIEFSTTSGFANGSGTQVPATDLGGGAFSADLSGLQPCTTYYVKAFATNSGGSGYGTQGSFTTASIGASTTVAASGIFSAGFTANWQPVAGATSYVLDVSTLPTFAVESYASDLFISEYIEATSGNEKYIEIYNGTAAPVNLADYQLQRFANGGTSPANIALSGTLAVGAVAVFKHTQATAWPGNAAGISGSLDFNGNDAVALRRISTNSYVDIFGRIGEDPGTAWSGGGNSTANTTLVRKNTVTAGVTTNPASGFPTLATQWNNMGGGNNVSSLGAHSSVVPSIVPSFVPGYQGLVVNGTSQAVTGLTLGQTYYYRVRAVVGACVSPNSNATSVTTVCDPVVLGPISTNSPVCSLAELELAANVVSGEQPMGFVWTGAGDIAPSPLEQQVVVTNGTSGTYSVTATNVCSNAQTSVDVTIEQATIWYLDADGDNFGDLDNTLMSCGQPEGYVAVPGDGCPFDGDKLSPGVCGCGTPDTDTDADGIADCIDSCPGVFGSEGSTCNDNNPFTSDDVLNASCACVGTPVPSHNWSLRIVTDAHGDETTWELREQVSNFLLASGGPYPSNSTIDQVVSVPDEGNWTLRVFDAGNDGITGGGYMLRDQNGNRVIDNLGNGAGFTSVSESPEGFRSPVGTDAMRAIDCDNVERWPFEMIVANPNPLVSAQWQVGTQTDDGYEFWFTNPNGGYSRHILRTHATSGGFAPANAQRACKLGLASFTVNPLPQNTLLNVRIRGIVNGAPQDWGPACRMKIDQVAANCHTTQLENIDATSFSCGVTGLKTNGSSRIWAKPVTRYIQATNTYVNANRYKFHFVNVGENTSFDIVLNSYPMLIYPQYPFQLGATYTVTVQASLDGGNTYCPAGAACQISFAATNTRSEAVSEELPSMGSDLQLWPNPNKGDELYLSMAGLESATGEVTIDVLNMFGEKVLGRTIAIGDNGLNFRMKLDSQLASGLYLVNLTADGKTITKRLVIQR